MSIPPRAREAKGTCEDVVTLPVPLALLTMSTWSVPLLPEIRTVGRLIVRSSWSVPSSFLWPTKWTPPEKAAVKAPEEPSYVPVAEWKRNWLAPAVAAPPVSE
jgi:hypothetical protein